MNENTHATDLDAILAVFEVKVSENECISAVGRLSESFESQSEANDRK